ncbi:hypothetical protein ABFG93_18540 [Pseudalkalibacillus hwajinpoensis]|uniref:hypothetical protein n=1 Tax=Guptibacillus hwajinpoensis TaxID=208199 RepID=UPI00325B3BF4
MEWFEITGIGGAIAILTFIRLKYGRHSSHHQHLREEVMLEKWSKERKIEDD